VVSLRLEGSLVYLLFVELIFINGFWDQLKLHITEHVANIKSLNRLTKVATPRLLDVQSDGHRRPSSNDLISRFETPLAVGDLEATYDVHLRLLESVL